jgi:hypothetical protein
MFGPTISVFSFSGPALLVEAAFHATVGRYLDGEREFYSNQQDPVLPSELASITQSLIGLNNASWPHLILPRMLRAPMAQTPVVLDPLH